MHAHGIEWTALAWFTGWCLALVTLWGLGLRLPFAWPRARYLARWRTGIYAGLALGIGLLANLALSLHDASFDFTRAKIFTPSAAALDVVDRLRAPVRITYFFRGDDPDARRARDVLEAMQRRNPRLSVRSLDPDRAPTLAGNAGVKLYNAAVIEAEGRRVLVHGTDETEIAIGIERVLRERVVVVCFVEGHGEYASENYEYHTHLDSAVGHSHGDAAAAVVDTTQHGVGRLRRSLESLGFVAQTISLAKPGGIPPECAAVIHAGPRTTYLPAETAALGDYLAGGGTAWLMFDLGFALEPGLRGLLGEYGVTMPPAVVVDPQSHHGRDPETVAVTAYEPHPITRDVSFTFYPGVRPLDLAARGDRDVRPLMMSSARSRRMTSAARPEREVDGEATVAAAQTGPQVLAAAIETPRATGASTRLVVTGDADFASNSFYPYAANSDLVLAIVRWLLREEDRTAIASRIPVPPALVLTRAQMSAVFWIVVVLLPGASAAIGAWLWWRRR
ncbi:MAG: GldG family protein [Gammaproteobacteria bacterium]